MGLSKAFEVAAVLAILAASAGHLPKIVRVVQIAQLRLIKQSQSSSWGKAVLLGRPIASREKLNGRKTKYMGNYSSAE
jgi:hypothetical protein